MIQKFLSGGVIMWPLLVIAIGTTWIAGRTASRILHDPPPPDELQRRTGAILFWGTVALVLGGVGTITGLVVIARAVIATGHVAMPIVWSGIAVTLVPLLFGIAIFLATAAAALTLGYGGRRAISHRHSGFSIHNSAISGMRQQNDPRTP